MVSRTRPGSKASGVRNANKRESSTILSSMACKLLILLYGGECKIQPHGKRGPTTPKTIRSGTFPTHISCIIKMLAACLRRKLTRSCGCFADECRRNPRLKFRTHGASHHNRTPEYISWVAMQQRCSNPKKDGYKYYGARGITVCARWKGRQGFEHFLADVGPRPKGTTLDREKVNGNYEPDNCKWATPTEQANNRRMKKAAA